VKLHIYRGYNFNLEYIFFILGDYKARMWCSGAGHIVQNNISMLLPRKFHFLNTGDFLIYFLRHPSRANSRRILIVFY